VDARQQLLHHFQGTLLVRFPCHQCQQGLVGVAALALALLQQILKLLQRFLLIVGT